MEFRDVSGCSSVFHEVSRAFQGVSVVFQGVVLTVTNFDYRQMFNFPLEDGI